MRSIKRDEDEGIGYIREILTSGRYRVELKSGRSVICYLAGVARKTKSQLTVGDRVRVELEGYHGKKGQITYRYRSPEMADEEVEEAADAGDTDEPDSPGEPDDAPEPPAPAAE